MERKVDFWMRFLYFAFEPFRKKLILVGFVVGWFRILVRIVGPFTTRIIKSAEDRP